MQEWRIRESHASMLFLPRMERIMSEAALPKNVALIDLLRLLLIAFSVSGTFISGCVYSIGIAFLPLINKSEIFLLISFYGSCILIVVGILRAIMIQIGKTEDEGTVIISNIFRLAFVCLSIIVIYSILSKLIIYIIDIDRNSHWRIFLISNFLCLSLSAIYAFLWKDVRVLYSSALFLMLVSHSTGVVYISFLKESGPRVLMNLQSGDSLRATIAFKAVDGFIVFTEVDKKTIYYPTSQIISIGEPTGSGSAS